MSDWQKVADFATRRANALPAEYASRLAFELREIIKQGANDYWLDLIKARRKFDVNPNGLVLPFVLGITTVDPIKAGIPHKVEYHADMPDIDCDLMPEARPHIKAYAIQKYGADNVCSVGLWQTFNPKLALQDVARALGADVHEAMQLTKDLPAEFDEMGKEAALDEYPEIAAYARAHPDVVDMAYRVVGRIKTAGIHAGGLVISSVPIRDYVPLMRLHINRDGIGEWATAWTEGRSPQLSKMGFVKFDMLGLKTIQYIWQACKLVERNRGVKIRWDEVPLDDAATLKLASDLKTDSSFQFDTDLAKSIIAKGGVKSFNDLLAYTSMGRPGPMPLCDLYIKRRDDPKQAWRGELHPKMVEALSDTYGVCIFQEQLQQVWVDVCGFTMAEAEAARKIIAKKRQEEMPALGHKVVAGASRVLGEKQAAALWADMVSFGRYAFNRSHAVAYCLIAYRTLYLKAHYPAEWWTAVMSECHRDRLARYVGIAKAEGTRFGSIDCRRLTESFDVTGDRVLPGLNVIKGIGSAAKKLAGQRDFQSLDEFILVHGKGKIVLERLIKLGAFDAIHPNRKALWIWYLYKYARHKKTREVVGTLFAWSEKRIAAERQKLAASFRKLHPKRKVPKKLAEWTPKIDPSFEQLAQRLHGHNFTAKEILSFEKEYLGFYWSSPMEQFVWRGHTIARARITGKLECVVEAKAMRRSEKTGNDYMKLTVTDGFESAALVAWSDTVAAATNAKALAVGNGISVSVSWSEKFRSFTIASGSVIVPLMRQ
jgi:DNA polymerase-3 subunit alpha